ncbi:MAG: MurR/RpiR family transcriptional regulator [Deltaproteobacteria bacterium]|jgi:DNA-binding MurR/RpiR family transcriptional regulator|nr:MurR/RpiR family transcriptional regulator [Deltaproteobacteria bacterium]
MNKSTKSIKYKIKEATLTSKGKQLAKFILANPGDAVFMTTRKLAKQVNTSEATVVRFVRKIGYNSYSQFLKSLRSYIDTELTLSESERNELSEFGGYRGPEDLKKSIIQEINNLKNLCSIDMKEFDKIVTLLDTSETAYIIGSRLSYAPAYYMGWAMTKIRNNINILKGSDRTSLDWLSIAAPESVVVIIATSRYPNELIRTGKIVRRLGHKLILLTDSTSCPLMQFCSHSLIASSSQIPFLGNLTSLTFLINYLVHALAKKRGTKLKEHQDRLEQLYWENDILFNFEKDEKISNN